MKLTRVPMDQVFEMLDLEDSTPKKRKSALRKVLKYFDFNGLKIYACGLGIGLNGEINPEIDPDYMGGCFKEGILEEDLSVKTKLDPLEPIQFNKIYIEPETRDGKLFIKSGSFIYKDKSYLIRSKNGKSNIFFVEYDLAFCDKNEILSLRKKIKDDKLYKDADVLPPYQDPDNEYYSKELDLAIKLHKAIHIDKCGNQSMSREARIASWIDKHKPELKSPSQAMLTRLSTIISINNK